MEDGIRIWDYRKLKIQKQLGRGTFGTVYLANCDEPDVTNPVVMKVMHQSLSAGDVARKLFIKEAKLLTGLHHENIVRMYGICRSPLTIVMEYVVFDFNSFGHFRKGIKVNTLDMFLSQIAQFSKTEDSVFDHLIPKIAIDVAKGILHLHENEIAHRDLKPVNILISNQHYSALQDREQIKRIQAIRPVVCKLADFGESRSQLLQTTGLNDPGTNQVFRGTIAFMAPEILLPEGMVPGRKLSLDDLKKVDIWALGLVFYCLINPGDSCPYERDGYHHPVDIMNLQRQRKRPSSDPEYQLKQSTVWLLVRDVYHACTNHDPVGRPRASDVVKTLCSPRHPGNRSISMTNLTPLRGEPLCETHTAVQWYVGDQGEQDLKYIFNKLTAIADGEVQMSRRKETQNLSMSFQRHGQQWQVSFPSDFPRSNASVFSNGDFCAVVGGDSVRTAVRAIISKINHSPAVGTHGNPTNQWYGGEQGETILKYVFNELINISDSEVKMSRKKDTQDVSMKFERFEQHWKVKFPSNFPRSDASLFINREFDAMVGGDTVEAAVRAIIHRISSLDQSSGGYPTCPPDAQWYEGEKGEATLKFVFSELTKIAHGDVQMSRRRDNQDITMCFCRQGQEWQVTFPSNFPSSEATLSINRRVNSTIGGNNVEDAVCAIVHHITSLDQNLQLLVMGGIQQVCSIT